MARRSFNPKEAEGPPPDPPPAHRERSLFSKVTDARQLTVSEVAALVKTTLEQRIPSPLRVVGEVSNFSDRNHWYFSLKDANAVLSCVAWASTAKKIPFKPADGDAVVATGHVSHYAPQGRTQFYVSKLEPVGAGALELRFRALCEELRGLGYFDEKRKRPLPGLPTRIAVITSATGAALQDVISTAAQRCTAVGLLVVDVRVQGEEAAAQVAHAIAMVNEQRVTLGVDAILVTRGGGSIEDLWAFNERAVADAVFASDLPLVAAIGHESDTTVIELVADQRAATPTQAVMLLVPSGADLKRQVDHLGSRLTLLVRRRVDREGQRLQLIARHPALHDPRATVTRGRDRLASRTVQLRGSVRELVTRAKLRIEEAAHALDTMRPIHVAGRQRERLAVLGDRLTRATRHRLDQRPFMAGCVTRLQAAGVRAITARRERVDWLERQLHSVEVRSVLRRGFSYTQQADGTAVRSIRDVGTGDALITHLADGTIESTVGRSTRRARKGGRRRMTGSAQMDLFDKSE